MVQEFRKKPVVIHAVQFTLEPWTASEIIQWILDNNGHATFYGDGELLDPGPHISIETLEGRMLAAVGDWVIRGIKGEFYPCKPDIFQGSYELAHGRRWTEIREEVENA